MKCSKILFTSFIFLLLLLTKHSAFNIAYLFQFDNRIIFHDERMVIGINFSDHAGAGNVGAA